MENEKVEDFYGVYLLCSESELKKYRNKVYIGFTVNPGRRVKQHNKGLEYGGARKTNKKGPWKMVMIVHGFPNNITALQFEWAWQEPKKSTRLKSISTIARKSSNETHFEYNFRILNEMLRVPPWNRLPLIVRWLAPEYIKEFPPEKIPPMHMKICYGHVTIIKRKPTNGANDAAGDQQTTSSLRVKFRRLECHLCMKTFDDPEESKISCINSKCKLVSHITCLASQCLLEESGHYIPIEGDCPICETHFLWGDLIRLKNGCNDIVDIGNENTDTQDTLMSSSSSRSSSPSSWSLSSSSEGEDEIEGKTDEETKHSNSSTKIDKNHQLYKDYYDGDGDGGKIDNFIVISDDSD